MAAQRNPPRSAPRARCRTIMDVPSQRSVLAHIDGSLRAGDGLTHIHGDDVEAILPLLGDQVRILHPRREVDDRTGGGDFDCAVSNSDDLWPLRLPPNWRLLQRVRYDITGCAWVLEHRGRTVAVDALDDPKGLGTHGFPTSRAFSAGHVSLPSARAAYLTSKRIVKGMRDASEWEHIRSLSEDDPDGMTFVLEAMFGSRTARDLSEAIRRGSPPDPGLWRRARVGLLARRMGGARFVSITGRSVVRVFDRVREPTGLHVLIVGPDGAGKSTLAEGLARACAGTFPGNDHFHWRPHMLPALGTFISTSQADASRPHARPPHSRALSFVALCYYWSDFLIGSGLRIFPWRVRTHLVISERGFWDMAVDPLRYRLQVPRSLVRTLGRLVPSPDLILVLEAPPASLLSRKSELPAHELARQFRAWREIVPRRGPVTFLDASRPLETVLQDAVDKTHGVLEERALARLGGGWTRLPSRKRARWMIPRAPRAVARTGIRIYQPVTMKGLIGWTAAGIACSIGANRFFPRGGAPPRQVREALGPHIPPHSTVALMKADRPGRFVALVIGTDGTLRMVAKIATSEEGKTVLAKEARAITSLGPMLAPPLAAPEVIDHSDGVLLLKPVPWDPRLFPGVLPEEVASCLGDLFRKTAISGGSLGAAHGDCAPWNLLRSGRRWVLIDWEEASESAPPFYDVLHYYVQTLVLLRRRSAAQILETIGRPAGHVRDALQAYARAAGLRAEEAVKHLPSYIELSSRMIAPVGADARLGLKVRREMLQMIGQEEAQIG